MPEFAEVFEDYLEENKMYHFEGTAGVRNINTIVETLGYRQGLQEFLADNPFVQQAIIDALLSQSNLPEEWTEKLMDGMDTYSSSESPDDEDDPAPL